MHSDDITATTADPREIAERLRKGAETGLVEELGKLPDDLKVSVVQQFFRHVEQGTHTTEYDARMVPMLLSEWFGIELPPTGPRAAAAADAPAGPGLPGRAPHPDVCHVDFGGTDLFFHMSTGGEQAAGELVEAITTDTVLSVARTSPPCEMAEVVPLWLQDRGRPAADYYLSERTDHPVAAYFDRVTDGVRTELGVEMTERSTEMAIVANADALRFHRDRLVNQYARLAETGADTGSYRLVQQLSLIDWDMQPGTVSGTVVDHPGGDRFLLPLGPGEVTGFFFTEPVRPPGPMMMPYHCALPVFDRSAGFTVGPARGKRLSALVRGLAPAAQTARLRERSVGLSLDAPAEAGAARTYASGIEIRAADGLPATRPVPTALPANDEGLSVVELSTEHNADLLRAVAPGSAAGARLYRVEKHGDGFSNLARAIPGLPAGARLFLVSRARNETGSRTVYPLTLDHTVRNRPWLQLLPLPQDAVVTVPPGAFDLVHLTPPDELLHRSALLDSFHPATSLGKRVRIALDLVVIP
ncbi:hypothetical protein O7599_35680 [Streptomyces sp. WMMC500]|uniref:hypothetical protein n=1 Tax=Streptomyces sp. WMMC500 TaxID=3015154 RepID=UPI00248B3877|nr:hypothetical protein [Streptomyces sp. WMMC500]WBB60776.1 hypothetical protein O7599_35680 [Streptomyces sp. WMMC500]